MHVNSGPIASRAPQPLPLTRAAADTGVIVRESWWVPCGVVVHRATPGCQERYMLLAVPATGAATGVLKYVHDFVVGAVWSGSTPCCAWLFRALALTVPATDAATGVSQICA